MRRGGPRPRTAGAVPERTKTRIAPRVGVAGAGAIVIVTLLGGIARAQSGPAASPPPAAAPAPTTVPIEPLTAGPVNASPVVSPGPLAAPAPADAPLIVPAAAPDNAPFYQKWWFWTAVGAAAVTTVAILIATSGSSAPRTDFGNMPAF